MVALENLVLGFVVYIINWLRSPEGEAMLQELLTEAETRITAYEAELNGQPVSPSAEPSGQTGVTGQPGPVGSPVDPSSLPKSLRGSQSSVPTN